MYEFRGPNMPTSGQEITSKLQAAPLADAAVMTRTGAMMVEIKRPHKISEEMNRRVHRLL